MEISNEVRAVEVHQKATSYYKASEQFGYKFLMEVKIIRDEKLFKDLGYEDFEQYTQSNFSYSRNTMNERILSAEAFGEEYNRALGSYGKHKTRQLAQMPEKERQQALEKGIPTDGGIKPVEEATTREIDRYQKQLKTQEEHFRKQLKQKDEQISNQSKTIEQLSNQEPEIREIEVEKIPQDYNSLKSSNNELTERLVEVQTNYEQLLSERREVDEKSAKYEQLTQAIRQAEGQLNGTQKLISNYNNLSDLLRQSNEFLSKASALVYQDLSEVIQRDGLAKQELDFLIERLEKFLSDLLNINKQTILEGEIIND